MITAGLHRRHSAWKFEPVNIYTRTVTGNAGRAHLPEPMKIRDGDPEADEELDVSPRLSTQDVDSYLQTLFKQVPAKGKKPPKTAATARPASKSPIPPPSPPIEAKSLKPKSGASSIASPRKAKATTSEPITKATKDAGTANPKQREGTTLQTPKAEIARGSGTVATPQKVKHAAPPKPEARTAHSSNTVSAARKAKHATPPRPETRSFQASGPNGAKSRDKSSGNDGTVLGKAKGPTSASAATLRRPKSQPQWKDPLITGSHAAHSNGPGTGGGTATASHESKSDRSRTPSPANKAPGDRPESVQRPVHATDPRGMDRRPSLGNSASPGSIKHDFSAPGPSSRKPPWQPPRSRPVDPAKAAQI